MLSCVWRVRIYKRVDRNL